MVTLFAQIFYTHYYPSHHDDNSLNWHETALYESTILTEVPKLDSEFFGSHCSTHPSNSNESSTIFKLLVPSLSSLDLQPPPCSQPVMVATTALTNRCVTALQSILTIEDSLLRALQHAMTIFDENNIILHPHISPSLHEQPFTKYNLLKLGWKLGMIPLRLWTLETRPLMIAPSR